MLTEKMNCLSFFFFILVPHSISFGRCHDISLSICWMSRNDALERQDGNIWLNHVALRSIRKAGKLTSLTLHPGVEHRLTLQHGGLAQTWTITVTPRTKSIKIRGRQRPSTHPTNATMDLLNLLHPSEVFACENGTLFFHQDENLFLATGHTRRLPVELGSRSTSMLLVSWMENRPAFGYSHAVSLYRNELGSYNPLSVDSTTHNHYRFTALDSCTPYVACVQIAGTRSFTCLSTMTDPDVPQDFEATTWNSSSLSLAWSCPDNRKYSLFLITVFYLNGTDHVISEEPVWYKEDSFLFTLSDLQPCSRVRFGLQTVCLAGLEPRYSRMVLNDGNSGHANIEVLQPASSGPDSYTLRWEVRDTSSISTFRVHHDGVLQGSTRFTNYTVGGLLPCHEYRAKVEALCGESVLMNSKTVTAHTGPRGVSELRFRSTDSTALWLPGTTQHPAVAFLYELSPENGGIVRSGRLTDAELYLPGLEKGRMYVLDVWEECDGQWESKRSSLSIEGAASSPQLPVRAAGPHQTLELQSDFSSTGLSLLLPWSLPDILQDDASEPRAKVENLFKHKLQELLKDFDEPARVEVVAIVPKSDADKTEILFVTFDATKREDVPLPVQDQLDYIRSLNATDVTVENGVIVWNGPDLCASSGTPLCPVYSVCVNTLGSHTCVCQHGYYDVSYVIEATRPICNEKGLFSQCVDKAMTGGIAKPYLTSYMGGKVDVTLNDGRCSVGERGDIFYFQTSRKSTECGTERQANKTHIVFQNTLSVTLAEEQPISRRDLKVVWKCVYPRHHVRKAQVSVDKEWFTSLSLVELNSSLQLALTMTLYSDDSYAQQYGDAVRLGLEDTLFFQVALQTNSSFASGVLLQVESCWATESTNPQGAVQGVFLQDGCPADDTFRWLSVNGLAQSSRFSIQMFKMPKGLPLYFHCLANVCGPEENCTKRCTSERRAKRSETLGKRGAVVSAGPLVINMRVKSRVGTTSWTETMTMILFVAGSVGILGVTVVSVSAAKAIMNYYKRPQQ